MYDAFSTGKTLHSNTEPLAFHLEQSAVFWKIECDGVYFHHKLSSPLTFWRWKSLWKKSLWNCFLQLRRIAASNRSLALVANNTKSSPVCRDTRETIGETKRHQSYQQMSSAFSYLYFFRILLCWPKGGTERRRPLYRKCLAQNPVGGNWINWINFRHFRSSFHSLCPLNKSNQVLQPTTSN